MQRATTTPMQGRPVVQIVRGKATSDGAGVRLTRIIGGDTLPDLDPFLLLDEFGSDNANDYIAGFPNHPHRGFETVTYMLAGRMRHRDNQGNSGLLTAGSVQWMTAGRGIVHSEMPEQENGLMQGFQLWVNLPASDKLTAPRYRDIAPESIPEVDAGDGTRVRVIAGRYRDTDGPVQGIATAPIYLDIQLAAGAHFEAALPEGHNAFVYAYKGLIRVGEDEQDLVRGDLAVLGKGGSVTVTTASASARLILVAGRPLNEPVVRYGPFVMNTQKEIRQAIEDYNARRF
jgi:quercetin 2,3-dioxygenase